MIRFEVRRVQGIPELVEEIRKHLPEVEEKWRCIYSQTEATYAVEHMLVLIRKLGLLYSVSQDEFSLFESGREDTLDLSVRGQSINNQSNVQDALGVVSFELSYGDAHRSAHSTLRSFARKQFSQVMEGVRTHRFKK